MGFLDVKAAFTAKLCDSCKSSAAAVFCRVDSVFLCLSCDSKLHCVNKHERVGICEVCEQAPAAVTCKADAAALCVSCDFDIHSANPLARRHERVPVEPFYDSADSVVKSSAMNFFANDELGRQTEEFDATNWVIQNSNNNNNNSNGLNSKMLENPVVKNGDFLFSEMDPFLDFEFPGSIDRFQQQGTNDSVVPVPTKPVSAAVPVINHSSENCFEIDFGRSKISPFNFSNHSISQSISSSEVGVVPDGNSMSEISYNSFGRVNQVPDSSLSVSGSTNQACGIDREARVLRYREKRKNRKFEKTIRYASRKAYAETRPRIKGRFAKRTEIGSEIDQIYGSASPAYGVVPTF